MGMVEEREVATAEEVRHTQKETETEGEKRRERDRQRKTETDRRRQADTDSSVVRETVRETERE